MSGVPNQFPSTLDVRPRAPSPTKAVDRANTGGRHVTVAPTCTHNIWPDADKRVSASIAALEEIHDGKEASRRLVGFGSAVELSAHHQHHGSTDGRRIGNSVCGGVNRPSIHVVESQHDTSAQERRGGFFGRNYLVKTTGRGSPRHFSRSRAGLTAGFVTRFAGTRGDIDRRLILVRSGSSSPAAWPGRRSVYSLRFAASRRHIDFQPLDQACQHNSNRLPRHLSVSVSRVSLRPERSDTRRPKSWKLQPPARTT